MAEDSNNQSTLEQIYRRFVEKLVVHEAFGEKLAAHVNSDLKQGKMASLDSVNAILGSQDGKQE